MNANNCINFLKVLLSIGYAAVISGVARKRLLSTYSRVNIAEKVWLCLFWLFEINQSAFVFPLLSFLTDTSLQRASERCIEKEISGQDVCLGLSICWKFSLFETFWGLLRALERFWDEFRNAKSTKGSAISLGPFWERAWRSPRRSFLQTEYSMRE